VSINGSTLARKGSRRRRPLWAPSRRSRREPDLHARRPRDPSPCPIRPPSESGLSLQPRASKSPTSKPCGIPLDGVPRGSNSSTPEIAISLPAVAISSSRHPGTG
jgi:hypothetical protein